MNDLKQALSETEETAYQNTATVGGKYKLCSDSETKTISATGTIRICECYEIWRRKPCL